MKIPGDRAGDLVEEGEFSGNHDEGVMALVTMPPSSSAMSIWDTLLGLSALMCGLVDGELVVAAVRVVTIDADERVVGVDVVEILDTADWEDAAEETETFFLAFSDCMEQIEYAHISAPILCVTRPMHDVITHVKVTIWLHFRIRNRVGALVEWASNWIFPGISEMSRRFQYL
jgi:hypothetical protein